MLAFDSRGFQPVSYSFTAPVQGASLPFSFPAMQTGPQMAQVVQLLQQLLQGLSQLSGAWSGVVSSPSSGGYSGTGGIIGAAGTPPVPSDGQEFASYLQAQRLGGSLEGKTGIAQRDALPGSRFAQVADSQAWQASLARNYAYQFAAYASGGDALTPEGMQKGQQAFNFMSDDARLFMQVASVFKGNLLNGPGFYDNPGLKQLLLSRGLGDLANKPGVGETDVQSIGAITIALNRGKLTLDDVIQSGTIDNLDRYQQVIGYVRSGHFNQDLNFYDSVPLS